MIAFWKYATRGVYWVYMKRIFLGLFVFALAVAGSGYYLAKDKLTDMGPDSPWYGVKLFSEWVQLQIPASDEQKIALKLKFMQERIVELADLENAKKLTKENVAKVQKSYNALAEDLMNSLKQQAQNAADEQKKALIAKAKQVTTQQQESLKKILDKAPDEIKTSLADIMKTVGDAYDRAVAVFQTE